MDIRARDRAVGAAKRASSGGKVAFDRGRRGVIYTITSDKVIQAVLTGSVVGFIGAVNEGFSAILQRWVLSVSATWVPVKLIAAVGMAGIFTAAFYADRNTEVWREWVEDVTGEETADDTADEEDVTGETKE